MDSLALQKLNHFTFIMYVLLRNLRILWIIWATRCTGCHKELTKLEMHLLRRLFLLDLRQDLSFGRYLGKTTRSSALQSGPPLAELEAQTCCLEFVHKEEIKIGLFDKDKLWIFWIQQICLWTRTAMFSFYSVCFDFYFFICWVFMSP